MSNVDNHCKYNCDITPSSTTPRLSCNSSYNSEAVATATRKRINKRVRVPASLYTMNLGAKTASGIYTSDNWNKDKKHASYDRYLARKKTLSSRNPCTCSYTGTVMNGPIIGATVQIFDAFSDNLIGTGKTNENGVYDIPSPGETGLASIYVVKATGGVDDNDDPNLVNMSGIYDGSSNGFSVTALTDICRAAVNQAINNGDILTPALLQNIA